jgi:integral membrane protein
MPLKYLPGTPLTVVGWTHVLPFMAYLVALASVCATDRWSLRRAAIAVLAALLPPGPFVLDAWLKRSGADAMPLSPPVR